jgi:hypothetical protein
MAAGGGAEVAAEGVLVAGAGLGVASQGLESR